MPAKGMLRASSTPNRCGRCGRCFTTSRALLRHFRETECHNGTASKVRKIFKCTKCSDTFTRDYDRRRHELRRHNRNARAIVVGHGAQQTDLVPPEQHDAWSNSSPHANPTSPERQIEADAVSTATITTPYTGSRQSKRSHEDMVQDTSLDGEICGLENLSLHNSKSLRRDPVEDKPILCTICRLPFDTNDVQRLLNHLNDHFRGFDAKHRCNECSIDFVHKADLDRHRISAAREDCGFNFHHTKPCTGHHPLGEDHIKLWDRIRHWQQCQLHSYIDRVEELSTRRIGARYVQTENSSSCRECRILEFYQRRFPKEYWAIYNKQLNEHKLSAETSARACCHPNITHSATDQLIAKLTSRRRKRRASMSDVERVRKKESSTAYTESCSIDESPATSEPDIFEILDTSCLSNPVQGLLHWAACAGDSAAIKASRVSGSDVHGADVSGRTALHYAAASGSCEAVDLLLEFGAKLDPVDHAGQTPLFLAVECGNADVVGLLLELGADSNAIDKMPQSCLHLAAAAGFAGIIERLVESGAEVDNVDCFDRTPLHLAVKFGHLEATRSLCKRNASVNAQDHAARDALCIAIENGSLDIAHYLLLHDAGCIRISDELLSRAIDKGANPALLGLLQERNHFTDMDYDRN